MVNKSEIRKRVKVLVGSLSTEQESYASEMILNAIEKLQEFKEANRILLYHSLKNEVNTIPYLIKWKVDKDLYLPQVEGDDLILHKYIGEENLKEGSYHIMEPEYQSEIINIKDIDLVIVPAVALSRDGCRVGHGKGYYDRLLQGVDVKKVGIIYHCQLCESFQVEPHDVRMDYVITEKETIKII